MSVPGGGGPGDRPPTDRPTAAPGAPDAGGRGPAPAVAPRRGAALLVADGIAVTPPGAGSPVLAGMTLAVSAGEWLALAGANGGGKTSLLLALAGLWPISAGRLTLAGEPFGPAGRAPAAARVAVVLQDPSSQLLQPTVGEELTFTARNLGLPEPEIERGVARWREALGLEVEPERDPATLSAGRQQIVLLVAALAARPCLLLADEATAHVDEATRRRVREALAPAIADGLAVVWATQDPGELAAAHRAVVVGAAGVAAPAAGPSAVAGPVRAPAPVALTIEVAASAAGEGPRVRTAGPFSVVVPARGVTALVGPNGAGKSVLLSAAAGLVSTPQLAVRWRVPPVNPAIMAFQFPELQVFEDRVADELVFAAVSRGVAREVALAAAAEQLRELGLDPARTMVRHTWSLSTGEKRLVEVVGALIAPAGLVLLDEPTAGLDPARRRALGGLVARRAASVPVLLATQDRAWAEGLGARLTGLGG